MANSKIKTVFFGSGNFAVKILQGILKFPFLEVVAVVTQPDKPAGRKKLLTPCPVMQEIINQGWQMPVYKPEKLKENAAEILAATEPDFILVADYGQFIPAAIIDYPKYKCLNVHGSLLPDLRGAVPAAMAILKGYTKTGVSIPVMTPGLDDGDLVASAEMELLATDTTYDVRMRLADIGNELLLKVLPDWFTGNIKAIPQDSNLATITKQSDIAKENAQITKDTDAVMAERMVRAFSPWPIAWVEASLNGQLKRVKIISSKLEQNIQFPAGLFTKHEKQLYLGLKNGALNLGEIQVEGKNVGTGKEHLFLNNILIE